MPGKTDIYDVLSDFREEIADKSLEEMEAILRGLGNMVKGKPASSTDKKVIGELESTVESMYDELFRKGRYVGNGSGQLKTKFLEIQDYVTQINSMLNSNQVHLPPGFGKTRALLLDLLFDTHLVPKAIIAAQVVQIIEHSSALFSTNLS